MKRLTSIDLEQPSARVKIELSVLADQLDTETRTRNIQDLAIKSAQPTYEAEDQKKHELQAYSTQASIVVFMAFVCTLCRYMSYNEWQRDCITKDSS